MPRYYIATKSFSAPIFSDSRVFYISAENPNEALLQLVHHEYHHPCGLYWAGVYESCGDDRLLGEYISNRGLAEREATKDKSCYTFQGHDSGKFEIDGKVIIVENPKEGKILI